ncbi:MAG: glycosyltransferase [Dehalococcoidia bacterium]|jgi:glycosyltransferase involved in cell wall biosynthesis
MKICIVGPSKRFFSGITAHTIFLANALSKDNQVSVVLFRNLLPRFLFPGREHIGKDQYYVNFTTDVDVYDGMDYNSPRSWFGAYKFLKRYRPEVIIIMWWTSSVAHMQLFLKLVNKLGIKAKIIVEMHEVVDILEESIWPIRIYSRVMGWMFVHGLDSYMAFSQIDKDRIVDIYHIDKEMVHVWPMGLYQDYFQPIDQVSAKQELLVDNEFVILYFGLIRHYKGVPFLIEAFNSLPSSIALHSRLLIVGEVWEDGELLRKRVDESPYKSQIVLVSQYIPDSMIPKYFSASDIVVLPYLRASGSAVAHIALTYGKPIILSDVPALREYMGDYQGTIFVKPGDSDAIRASIEAVYKSVVSGQDLHYKSTHATWDDIARKYETIIGSLISRGAVE